MSAIKKTASLRFFGVSQQTALVGLLLAWAFWTVEPVGQREQAENYKHDDDDVMGLHGDSLWVG
jgi:hypothetical protein